MATNPLSTPKQLFLALQVVLIVWTANGFSLKTSERPLTTVERPLLERLDKLLTRIQNPEKQLKDHTYLSGNYAPVSDENVEVPVEIVEGSLPNNLNGMFSRNGPNPIANRPIEKRKRYHWFDGHAMLHNLLIEDGKAKYTNQFVPSIRYQIEQELDEEFFPTLGEYDGLVGLAKILFHPKMVRRRVPDLKTVLPPNTNVLMFDSKFYCLNESNLPFECKVSPDGTLQPVGYETFNGLLDYPVSAHPHVDGKKLLFHSYTTDIELIARDGPMKVGAYDAETKQLDFYFSPTNETYISFAHGMMYTENYMIIWDCNVHFDPKGMFDGGSFFRAMQDHNLRFGVVPRNATNPNDVIWIDTGHSAAIVHPLNAWEEKNGTIVMWTPRCKNLIVDLESDDLNLFNMVEYRIDPRTRTSIMTVIDDTVNIEFSVAPQLGKFTRYGFTAIQDPSTPGEGSFSGFCTWDMETRSYQATYYAEHEVGGEPMVAQAPDGEIYVGTYLYNFREEQSYFVLYNGQTNELVCRLKMPFRVPFGFHGQWISKEELQAHFAHHGTGQ